VKSFKSGEQKYSALTNNCGQAGVDILHNAGFTGAPTAALPGVLQGAMDFWFKLVNEHLIRKTEEIPQPPDK
jgi:hypothetical protein